MELKFTVIAADFNIYIYIYILNNINAFFYFNITDKSSFMSLLYENTRTQ